MLIRCIAAAIAVLWFAASSAQPAEPRKIRIAWAAVPGQLPAVLYQKHEILKHYGQSYTVEPSYNRGSGTQITALAAGELQLALYAPSALALTVENAHMDDIRVIAAATGDGFAEYY